MTAVLRDIAVIGGGCYGTFYAGQLAQALDRGKLSYRRVLVVDHDPGCRATRELPPRADRRVIAEDWDQFLDRFLVVDDERVISRRAGSAELDRIMPGRAGSAGLDRSMPGRACISPGEDRPTSGRAPTMSSAGSGVPAYPTDPTDPDDAIVPSPLMPHLMAAWLMRRARARWPGRLVEQRPLGAEVGTPYESTGPDGTRYLSFADWICPVHCIEPLTCPVIRGPRTWELSDTLAAFSSDQGLAEPATFHCHHEAFGVGMFHAREARHGWRLVERAGAAGQPADVVVGTVSRCHGAVAVLHLGDNGEGKREHERQF